MDSVIKKADDSADVRVDKYAEATKADDSADVRVDKYSNNTKRSRRSVGEKGVY